MHEKRLTPSGKPYDIHERLLIFACDIVNAVQFLHSRGPIARAFSYQLLSASTSTGAHAEEADGASSHDDFIAKNRIALKERKRASGFASVAAAIFLVRVSIPSCRSLTS